VIGFFNIPLGDDYTIGQKILELIVFICFLAVSCEYIDGKPVAAFQSALVGYGTISYRPSMIGSGLDDIFLADEHFFYQSEDEITNSIENFDQLSSMDLRYFDCSSFFISNEERVIFHPPSIVIINTTVSIMKVFTFFMTNTLSYNISLESVAIPSTDVFCSLPSDKVIEPDQTVKIKVFICSSKEGIITVPIVLKSSIGSLVYPLCISSSGGDPPLDVPCKIFQSTIFKNSFSIDLPESFTKKNSAIVYDSNMFIVSQSSFSRQFDFYINNLENGTYITFLSLYNKGIMYTYPVFIKHEFELLFSDPSCVFLRVSDTSDISSVKLINPTPNSIIIESINKSHDFPESLVVQQKTTIIPPNCQVEFASLILHNNNKYGYFDSFLSVSYFSLSIGHQNLSIPIKGFILNGSLYSIPPVIHSLPIVQNEYSFRIENKYEIPILVFMISINSSFFHVSESYPILIPPFSCSQKINIFCSGANEIIIDPIVVVVCTNVSTLYVPIKVYKGTIGFMNSNNSIFESVKIIKLGQVLSNSFIKIPLSIYNPNPEPILLTSINCTSGIEIFSQLSDSFPSFRQTWIPSFSEYELELYVHFLHTTKVKFTKDVLFLHSQFGTLKVEINWVPINGDFQISNAITHDNILGSIIKSNLTAQSTYSKRIQIQKVSSSLPSFAIEMSQKSLDPFSRIFIGDYSILLDNTVVYQTFLHEFFSISTTWSYAKSAFYVVQSNMIPLNYYIYFELDNNVFFRQEFNLSISLKKAPDIFVERVFGYSHTYSCINISIQNEFFSGNELFFIDPKLPGCSLSFQNGSMVIQPNSKSVFSMCLKYFTTGKKSMTIPVLSNTSFPFLIQIHPVILSPNIVIDRNYEVSRYDFSIEHVLFGEKMYNISIRNLGSLPFSVYSLILNCPQEKSHFKPLIRYINTDCIREMAPNDMCFVYFRVYTRFPSQINQSMVLEMETEVGNISNVIPFIINREVYSITVRNYFVYLIVSLFLSLSLPFSSFLLCVIKYFKRRNWISRKVLSQSREIRFYSRKLNSIWVQTEKEETIEPDGVYCIADFDTEQLQINAKLAIEKINKK